MGEWGDLEAVDVFASFEAQISRKTVWRNVQDDANEVQQSCYPNQARHLNV